MKNIQDALHGYIELSDEEVNVLDSPEMQRLRRIKQLGLSSLVYPSATHTRFQHSLGVMHIAGRFAQSLGLDEEKEKELRMAGLLHDSGHGPFSHASEVVAEKKGHSHEDFSCEIVDKLEDSYSVDPVRVRKIIKGELEIGQVVSGDIDSDRMDYLMRDAHASGLKHGHIDYETIVRLAQIDSRRLVFDSKAVQALESLFTARFHMMKTLYQHHTSLVAEKMLQRSLENFLEEGVGIRELIRLDDYTAHSRLSKSEGSAGVLYKQISERNLYKRAIVWGPEELTREGLKSVEKRIENPRELEKRIAEEASVPEHEVIIDKPSIPDHEELNVKIKSGQDIGPLEDFSPIPEALEDARWRNVALRVYAPEDKIEDVKSSAETVLKSYSKVLSQYM